MYQIFALVLHIHDQKPTKNDFPRGPRGFGTFPSSGRGGTVAVWVFKKKLSAFSEVELAGPHSLQKRHELGTKVTLGPNFSGSRAWWQMVEIGCDLDSPSLSL